MRIFYFTSLAVFSYVAVIAATPLGNSTPAQAIDRRQEYVHLTARGGSDSIEKYFSSPSCSDYPETCEQMCFEYPEFCEQMCSEYPDLQICSPYY